MTLCGSETISFWLSDQKKTNKAFIFYIQHLQVHICSRRELVVPEGSLGAMLDGARSRRGAVPPWGH